MRRRHAVWLLGVAACAEERALPELDEVRVSTHRELDPIVPPTGQTTSAALQELVCPAVDREFEIRQIDATTFDLTRKPSSPRSLDDLAQKLRHRDLVSARVDSGAVRVTLKPGAYPSLLCIEDGDYRVASYARTELVLERARGAGIHRIRALAFHDSEEEWRRFLAREVDVAPAVNQGQLRYLRELPTVKLVGGQTAHATGLRFNTERVPQELRKAISLAIHRKAGIKTAKDLEGKRVGVPLFTMTAAIYINGLLQHEYGVDFSKVTWVQGAINTAGAHGSQPRPRPLCEGSTLCFSSSDLAPSVASCSNWAMNPCRHSQDQHSRRCDVRCNCTRSPLTSSSESFSWPLPAMCQLPTSCLSQFARANLRSREKGPPVAQQVASAPSIRPPTPAHLSQAKRAAARSISTFSTNK